MVFRVSRTITTLSKSKDLIDENFLFNQHLFIELDRRIPPSDATDEQIQLTKIENQRLQQELDAMEYKFRKLDDRSFLFFVE